MPIAQRGISRAKRDKRRSHHKVKPPTTIDCPNCHQPKLPHTVCQACGFYKGRQVIRPREE